MANDHDLQPLLDVQQNQLSFLSGISDGIDTKSLAVLAADVAVLIYMVQASLDVRWWGIVLCVLPFLVSLGLSIAAVWPREYQGTVINLDTHPEYLSLESEQLLLQLVSDTQESINTNAALNSLRLRFCVGSMLTAGLATALLVVILLT